MKKTTITLDEWQQALSDVMAKRAEPVPSGWITTAGFAKERGLGNSQAGKQMQLLIAAGRVETKEFRILAGSRLIPVPHYRLKK